MLYVFHKLTRSSFGQFRLVEVKLRPNLNVKCGVVTVIETEPKLPPNRNCSLRQFQRRNCNRNRISVGLYCDILLVVSGGADCGRRWQNVYDKKPQCYAKDNRKVHSTARSDKSVACVTNNKRLYSTFCTVEANYWQTRSIARPLCDSRTTCLNSGNVFS